MSISIGSASVSDSILRLKQRQLRLVTVPGTGKKKLCPTIWEKFGHGTRSCIRKNISIMEMGKLVPQILREFNMEWASEKDEWTVPTFWFAKQTDMIVHFRPRISKGLKEKV
jgi:hypothetical protein